MMSKAAVLAMHAALAKDPMNTYRSYVSLLEDPTARDESKVKAVQELSGDLETIVAHPQYPAFLDHAFRIFLKVLQEGDPHFLSDHAVQQLRKLILEIIHRIPADQNLKRHVKDILSLMFRLLQVENEENVLVCLRIIIELHKTFRPDFTHEIKSFLQFVKRIYRELPNHLNKIFEPRPSIKIRDINVNTLELILNETFTITVIHLEKTDEPTTQYNLIPRATYSLKVLSELPIIVVLMYQLYKQNVHHDVEEFIPLIMGTITLHPSEQHRKHPAFNKEVFVDFMAAQIKTLSFLAYIVRIYQTVVNENSSELARGMLALLRFCPPEVAHLRKELLIAARHILATDLREKFVDSLDDFFDENILIGSGWTAYESLRPLAYSTLADLVHHVRQKLSLKDLSKAVTVFSKIVHEESLVTTIQTMSCKLLLNLVDCIRVKSEEENGNGREIFMRMLEVFVLKFKTIAKMQLPVLTAKMTAKDTLGRLQHQPFISANILMANVAAASAHQVTVPQPVLHAPVAVPIVAGMSSTPDVKIEHKDEPRVVTATFPAGGLTDGRDDKPKFGFPSSQAANYSVADCRSLVKTLVCGVKTITWGILSKKMPQEAAHMQKRFQPKETLVLIRLIKYAFQALDVYSLSVPMPGQPHPRTHNVQTARSKEEKDVLEHLAGVYTMIHPMTFKEVFSTTIDYMVDRINKNYALQIVANSFLTHSTISPIFATILVEYLLKRMEEMGSNMERSNLYLKLFKLVFGSVSLFPAENEQMLKPYLHQIVNRSMELALSAKEPYNYFLLLRALFRSIGGGSHDLLYQEFLPLLPNLLQGLNSLQSGLHKQHMKDLFVELCLTVPVRLSSLLPYLPMLMDPLVSALNGSQTLVSQGLRTLELCVDNLQPDFLYDHIQPVRAELMQALWRTLRNPNDNIAQVAFRVLGKFGGGNRKMMIEPQKLEYNARDNVGPCITVQFPDDDFPDRQSNISMPVEKIIETAFNALKSSSTDSFYREQCWEVIKGFLAATIEQSRDEHYCILKFFSHPDFSAEDIDPVVGPLYNCQDVESRKALEMALTGMFVAVAIKELRTSVLPFMVGLVYHYTGLMVGQQCGIYVGSGRQVKFPGMDPLVLIDAVASIMGHEEKELCKPGKLALVLIIDTASIYLSSGTRASQLPFYEHLVERMCSLCYERAWYAKHGGCVAIQSLMERIPGKWVYSQMYTFLKALLFVMMDLTGEVSSGAVDLAKSNLERLLTDHGTPIVRDGNKDSLVEAQNKAINEVIQELIRLLTSPNTCVREQAMHSLRVLAKVSNKTVTQVIEPHRELLVDVIPPRKYLLRHKPVNSQIGLLDANTFCITLKPRLFTIDLTNTEHKTFFDELKSICEKEDVLLQKLYPCYKSVSNLVPLRKAALRVLSSCHHLESQRRDIYILLYKALDSPNTELQEAAFDCMKQLISGCDLDLDMVCGEFRPLLMKLGDYRSLTLPVITQLSYLTQLFPKCFNEKLCEQLLSHLKECLQVAINKSKERISVTDIKICTAIMSIFHQIPDASAKLIPSLLSLLLETESGLMLEAGSPFREPVVKFLCRYPQHTLELLLAEPQLQNQEASRFLEYLVKGDHGRPFREHLQKNTKLLVSMLLNSWNVQNAAGNANHAIEQTQICYMCIRITSLIAKYDNKWLADQHELIACLRKIWISNEFEGRHQKIDSVDYSQWKEPKLLVKCLLNFVQHHEDDIELLFQLLRAFTGRFIPDFEFLRNFLENTVANTYSVKWKRLAFFGFVNIFLNPAHTQELKAKILQYVIIPSFAVAFERKEGELLIGGPPSPEQEQKDNVISIFILKVIDPENPFATSDAVRILLLQLSCLLVEQAHPHIHVAANKTSGCQGHKLRRLMTYAWPCLLTKNCVDPATKYHGHLLLANIIAKFAIHKRIVLQVFHSLLKAHAAEARQVVRQALEILTPVMPIRMEDDNSMLTHWTKKIIVEEGHTLAQLVHLLQLLVRHYKVYKPVRHHLIQHMVSSVQRLFITPNATLEHKKLAVDLAEVVIRWELERTKEEQKRSAMSEKMEIGESSQAGMSTMVRTVADPQDLRRLKGFVGVPGKAAIDLLDRNLNKPVDKIHSDAIVNFLLRMACQVNDTQTTTAGASGEMLSRRCVTLLKTALKPEVWPNAELKLAWFDKPLSTVDSAQPNFANICTALELLAFLLSILRKETILATFRPLQRSIAACLSCQNSKVIRSVHNLLSHLMKIFPTEPTNSNVASKYEELDGLYASVSKVVIEGLQAYEKSTTTSPCALYGTLMILKAACVSNPCYIDRLIATFMRSLQKMQKDHLNPPTGDTNPMNTDLLILSLDLVKNRVGVMGQDMRKTFIGTILVGLIEKSPDVKVLRAITKMVEDWVKCKSPIAVNQSPTIREKSILQVKMMQFIEKRFPNELELNAQFLELVHYVYNEQTLKGTELQMKLEPAFMAGLRCVQPHIRAKFFQVYDTSLRRRLHERLMYVVCSQNWETIGGHFWIKQVIELLLVTASIETTIQCATQNILLPSFMSIIDMADLKVKENFAHMMPIKEESSSDMSDHRDEDDSTNRTYQQHPNLGFSQSDANRFREDSFMEYSLSEDSSKSSLNDGGQGRLASVTARRNVRLSKQVSFLSSLQKHKTINFLKATAQLCHMDTSLAHHLWVQLFPRLWKILTERQQNVLAAEIVPFLCSGSHVLQKDCHPSAMGTFAEGVSHCLPLVLMKPLLLKYLGKSHNLWHRTCLLLEQISFEKTLSSQVKSRVMLVEPLDGDGGFSSQHESLDMIVDMYAQLKEEDLWAGVWQKRAKFPETSTAIALEQQGFFHQASAVYEEVLAKARPDLNYPSPVPLQSELDLWTEHWCRCNRELNQWEMLLEYGSVKECYNPMLVLETAWRNKNWDVMKSALERVEQSSPKELTWKLNMYKGYLYICHPLDRHLNMVERQVELASNLCIREWRRLPHIVSHIHLPILQAAQQISELQDASQIHQGLLPPNMGRQTSLHDMKAIVKTWRNRLPVLSDDLSHWGEIFAWRQEHYGTIVNSYDPNNCQIDAQNNNAMLGVHASAQSTIHFGKIARKHGLPMVCLESLGKLHAIPSVPIVDCFQKIRQQVKCHLQLAHIHGKSEPQEANNALNQGLKAIEATNLKYFSKDMTAEIYAIKGLFLDQMARTEEANKAFSAAIQLHDTLVKAWALWGEYCENLFTKDKSETRNMEMGVAALTCYLHACRHQNESKSRKYLAKVFWLLTYDDSQLQLAGAVDQYSAGIPPVQWLPWIPQLLTCLVRNEGGSLMNVLCQVGRMFPQAVFFPIRTLYLILKLENRERRTLLFKDKVDATVVRTQTAGFGGTSPAAAGTLPPLTEPQSPSTPRAPTEAAIRATPPMWRCSRIMNYQREHHPTALASLEGIVEQMVWFRDNVYEEILRQLRQGLAKCYAVAYDNASAVSEAIVTPHTLNFVNKLVLTFGIGIEHVTHVSQSHPTAASESLVRRAQATAQDPVFQKMKGQFTADFDFNAPGARKLQNLIVKLKKWIKILEAKTKLLPKSFLIEEKCRFLSHFSQQTAEIEIPGEFLLPRPNHYYVRIARFMPRVDIVQKHNTAARRLYIKGHNGKIYPYLIINDACLSDARREERVLQLLRMLNSYLGKQKETSRRFLNFTVPRVLSLSPQMRLVEDNVSSISLLDIYKQCCEKRGIEHDAPLFRYYEKLAAVQARGSQASHQVLRDILKDVQNIMVSRTLLKDWADRTYTSATDYWTFRKQFTLQLSLIGFIEYVFHLTRLNPDMMYIHQDSGLMNVAYFRFNVDDTTGELDPNFGPIRPVPFRLTPNIAEFITTIGICGPMIASMIATARCLVQPNFKVQALFRAVLRDEMIGWHKKRQDDTQQAVISQEMEGVRLIQMVNKAVNAITLRLQSLASFDGADSKVSTLVAAANSPDNLCRMDPAWHPWL